jgi:hypothetical protein
MLEQAIFIPRKYPLSYGFWGKESDRNTSKNLITRTILFFARDNSRYRFLTGSMGLGGDPTISDQRIPPCLPAGRYKIFPGIPDEF